MRKYLRNLMLLAVVLITIGVSQTVVHADTTTPPAVTLDTQPELTLDTQPELTLDTQPVLNSLDELESAISDKGGLKDNTPFIMNVSYDGATLQLDSEGMNDSIVRIYWTISKTEGNTEILPVNTMSIPTNNIWDTTVKAYILVVDQDGEYSWYLAKINTWYIKGLKDLQLAIKSMSKEDSTSHSITTNNNGTLSVSGLNSGYNICWVASDAATGEKRFLTETGINDWAGSNLWTGQFAELSGKTITFFAFPKDTSLTTYYTGSTVIPAATLGNIEVPTKIELGADCNIKLSNLTAPGNYYIALGGEQNQLGNKQILVDKTASTINIKEYLSSLTKSTLLDVALMYQKEKEDGNYDFIPQEQICAYRIQVNNPNQIEIESSYGNNIPTDSVDAKMYIRNLDKDYYYKLEYKSYYSDVDPITMAEGSIPKGVFSIVELPATSTESFIKLVADDKCCYSNGNFEFNVYSKADDNLVSTTELLYNPEYSCKDFPTTVSDKTSGTITIPYVTRNMYKDELYYSVNGVEHKLNSDSINVSDADADSDGLVTVKVYSVGSEKQSAM